MDVIAGGAVLGLSVLLFSQVLPGQFSGVALARNPMSFPRFLLALMAFGGTVLVLRGVFGSPTCIAPPIDWRRLGLAALLVAAYFTAFDPLGFAPATALFLPAIMVVLGYRRFAAIAIATALTISVLWFLFAEIFVIRPPGIGFDTVWRSVRGDG